MDLESWIQSWAIQDNVLCTGTHAGGRKEVPATASGCRSVDDDSSYAFDSIE